MNVSRPTATALGTVLVPFQDREGHAVVAEFSKRQFHTLVLEIHREFERIDREIEVGRAVLAIARHESVT